MGRNHIHLFSADLLHEEPRGSHDTILFLVGAPGCPKSRSQRASMPRQIQINDLIQRKSMRH